MIDIQAERALSALFGSSGLTDPKGRPIDDYSAFELKWRSNRDRVGDTRLSGELPTTRISTVWMPVQMPAARHSWAQFETMIFSDFEPLNEAVWRWATWREAEIGHHRVVRVAKLVLRRPLPVAKPLKRRHWR